MPLPIDGKAIVATFFSSASVRAFFTTDSKSCSGFPLPHTGLNTCIICFAFKLGASPMRAKQNKKNSQQDHV